jgi:hypothetical protein
MQATLHADAAHYACEGVFCTLRWGISGSAKPRTCRGGAPDGMNRCTARAREPWHVY